MHFPYLFLTSYLFFPLFSVFDPEGPLWIQVVDPENGENIVNDEESSQDNAELEPHHNNAQNNKHNEGEALEPPSPSKQVYENTACLQKKRIKE